MTVAQMRQTTADRLAALEKRADGHDSRAEAHEKKIAPMVDQVGEMYELLRKWRNINWFIVKLSAGATAGLGGLAVLLTIIDKAQQLTGHH